MSVDQKYIVTGCNDGQLCVWDVDAEWNVWHFIVKMREHDPYPIIMFIISRRALAQEGDYKMHHVCVCACVTKL